MKLKIFISFNIKEGTNNFFKDFFIVNNKKDIAEEFEKPYPLFRNFKLDFHDPLLNNSRKFLKRYAENWGERIDYEFDKEELDSCKLLTFGGLRYPKIFAGPETGTKYDLTNACKRCGSGAIQVGPLRIRPSDLKKLDVQNGIYWHVIISKRLRDLFLKENVSGVEFREITSKIDSKGLNYYQIIPKYNLPPSLPSSFEIDNQCPVCKRDGYFDGHIEGEPKILKYKLSEDTLNKADFFFSYELLGYSILRKPFEKSIFNQPKVLVIPKIFKIVSKLKIKEAGFYPVIVNNLPNIEKWKEESKK